MNRREQVSSDDLHELAVLHALGSCDARDRVAFEEHLHPSALPNRVTLALCIGQVPIWLATSVHLPICADQIQKRSDQLAPLDQFRVMTLWGLRDLVPSLYSDTSIRPLAEESLLPFHQGCGRL